MPRLQTFARQFPAEFCQVRLFQNLKFWNSNLQKRSFVRLFSPALAKGFRPEKLQSLVSACQNSLAFWNRLIRKNSFWLRKNSFSFRVIFLCLKEYKSAITCGSFRYPFAQARAFLSAAVIVSRVSGMPLQSFWRAASTRRGIPGKPISSLRNLATAVSLAAL